MRERAAGWIDERGTFKGRKKENVKKVQKSATDAPVA